MNTVAATMMLAAVPLFATEADTRIETAFKDSYVNRVYLKGDSVKPEAKNGVLTLTGTVADKNHRMLAQETGESLMGVTRVDNQLETKAEVATDNADTWIGRRVEWTLFFHRNVSASATTVDVNSGVVTLTGEASSAASKELTGEYAGDVDGVKSVTNNMTIAKAEAPATRTAGEKLDDASITAQTRMALASHRSTSTTKIKVETHEGVVTLTGIAANTAEKSLVSKLVRDIHGVTDVKNEMTIQAVPSK